MKNKPQLELADVKKIAAAAEAEALKHQWPVSIAIVDDGGHLLWLQRLDGAAAISAHIAPAKAYASALGRRDTKGYEDMINTGRSAFRASPPLHRAVCSKAGWPSCTTGNAWARLAFLASRPRKMPRWPRQG